MQHESFTQAGTCSNGKAICADSNGRNQEGQTRHMLQGQDRRRAEDRVLIDIVAENHVSMSTLSFALLLTLFVQHVASCWRDSSQVSIITLEQQLPLQVEDTVSSFETSL